jgi:hypothetical protein
MVQPIAVMHLLLPGAAKSAGGEDANASHPVADQEAGITPDQQSAAGSATPDEYLKRWFPLL